MLFEFKKRKAQIGMIMDATGTSFDVDVYQSMISKVNNNTIASANEIEKSYFYGAMKICMMNKK